MVKKENTTIAYRQNFDKNLWAKFKSKLALENKTIQEKFLEWIKEYVKK